MKKILNGEVVEMADEEIAARLAEIDAEKALIEATSYRYKRQDAYPPITEYIDGVVKGDQAQIDKYISDCLAVKAKYPKP
jgi:hypothetical protein